MKKEMMQWLSRLLLIAFGMLVISFFCHERKIVVKIDSMQHLGSNCIVSGYMDEIAFQSLKEHGDHNAHMHSLRQWGALSTVDVRWVVRQWDGKLQEENDASLKKMEIYKAIVHLDRYGNHDTLCVHIFPEGRVRVVRGECDQHFVLDSHDQHVRKAKMIRGNPGDIGPMGTVFTKDAYKKIMDKIPTNKWKKLRVS